MERIFYADASADAFFCDVLRRDDGVLLVPTETVYGLVCDAAHEVAERYKTVIHPGERLRKDGLKIFVYFVSVNVLRLTRQGARKRSRADAYFKNKVGFIDTCHPRDVIEKRRIGNKILSVTFIESEIGFYYYIF